MEKTLSDEIPVPRWAVTRTQSARLSTERTDGGRWMGWRMLGEEKATGSILDRPGWDGSKQASKQAPPQSKRRTGDGKGGGGRRGRAEEAQRTHKTRSHKGREGMGLTRMDGNEVSVGWPLVEQSSGVVYMRGKKRSLGAVRFCLWSSCGRGGLSRPRPRLSKSSARSSE